MSTWWGALDTSLKVFYAIGLGSSVVLLLQLALLTLGLDGDDLDADLSDGGDAGILSIRTVTAFMVGFGWTGVAAINAGRSVAFASIAGLVVGSAFMASVVFMMRLLYSMKSSGTLDYENAIGATGKVYLPIPAAMERPGQIEVVVQGRLRVVDAFTRNEEALARHAQVKVIDLVDPTSLLVEPLAGHTGTAPAD